MIIYCYKIILLQISKAFKKIVVIWFLENRIHKVLEILNS